MPSFISSSEPATAVRLTAADRPGVAQPVPVRDVPAQPWRAAFAAAAILAVLMITGWEWYWREFGATPGIQNTEGLWAIQRRRIDAGEGSATVLIGASRVLFDTQLSVWEKASGKRPIQLALEGTSPMFALEDLADDPNFTGHLLVGVAPDIFFSGYEYRKGVLKYLHEETPSQWAGQWLSMHLLEPFLAFLEPDFALFTVVERQAWPARPGIESSTEVRKLAVMGPDRDTHIWSKLETDPAYRALARRIWAQNFDRPPPTAEEKTAAEKTLEEQFRRAAAAVTKLRARGVPVLFVRYPSDGEYLAFEDRVFPRAATWDVLIKRTGAPGIHFQDYPELQGYYLPEWSHISRADAQRFTKALHDIVVRDFWPAS